ncbi:GAF domain-containing protein [Chloroflexota bacterium]
MKLQIKVSLLVIAILLVIGIISGGMMLYFQRIAGTDQFEQTAMALAKAVQGSLEQGMMLGERKHIQEAMVRVEGEEMVTKVALFSPDGVIAASSKTSDIGQPTDIEEVKQALQSGEAITRTKRLNGLSELWIITPLFNKPECHSCHSQGQVLGAIQISLDATPLDNQSEQQTMFFAIWGALTLVIIGGGLVFTLKKTVLNPLSGLTKSTLKLSQGDYSERARSDQNDEIGILARTFNEMAENVEQHSQDLEKSHKELSVLNVGLEERIRQRTKEITALNTVLTIINQFPDEGKMLRNTLTSILNETELAAGMVHMIDEKSNELVCISQQGLSVESSAKLTGLEFGENIQGQAFQSKEVIVVNDYNHTHKTCTMTGEKGKFRSCISLPIKSQVSVLGTLSLASYTTERFEPETVRLLMAISEAICIAVEKTRATDRVEESNRVREHLLERLISAQEEERRRIARELHDAASQSLAALALNLDTVASDLPAKYHNIRGRLAFLKENAIETMTGIRELALELRPSILDDLGLARAIKSYAKDYLGKRGIDVEVNVTGSNIRLPQYSETMLFRIAQEALTNIVNHAEASQVIVELSLSSSSATMRVEDNGKGFDSESVLRDANLRQSLGVYSMSERAMLLGGTFSIKSEIGKGTFVSAEIPLEDVKISHG